eukprot:1037220-Prorocentrum_lima.AAC.1
MQERGKRGGEERTVQREHWSREEPLPENCRRAGPELHDELPEGMLISRMQPRWSLVANTARRPNA